MIRSVLSADGTLDERLDQRARPGPARAIATASSSRPAKTVLRITSPRGWLRSIASVVARAPATARRLRGALGAGRPSLVDLAVPADEADRDHVHHQGHHEEHGADGEDRLVARSCRSGCHRWRWCAMKEVIAWHRLDRVEGRAGGVEPAAISDDHRLPDRARDRQHDRGDDARERRREDDPGRDLAPWSRRARRRLRAARAEPPSSRPRRSRR